MSENIYEAFDQALAELQSPRGIKRMLTEASEYIDKDNYGAAGALLLAARAQLEALRKREE